MDNLSGCNWMDIHLHPFTSHPFTSLVYLSSDKKERMYRRNKGQPSKQTVAARPTVADDIWTPNDGLLLLPGGQSAPGIGDKGVSL